jgi:hypothetical protein
MNKKHYDEICSILFRESRPDLVNQLTGTQGFNNAVKLDRATELLEACSENLFLGFGDDVELEHHVDTFLKEIKS